MEIKTMARYHQEEVESTGRPDWIRWSAIGAMVGGWGSDGGDQPVPVHRSELQEFELVEPPAILGGILLALALPAYYLSERRWFGRLARVGFAALALGTTVTAIALPPPTAPGSSSSSTFSVC